MQLNTWLKKQTYVNRYLQTIVLAKHEMKKSVCVVNMYTSHRQLQSLCWKVTEISVVYLYDIVRFCFPYLVLFPYLGLPLKRETCDYTLHTVNIQILFLPTVYQFLAFSLNEVSNGYKFQKKIKKHNTNTYTSHKFCYEKFQWRSRSTLDTYSHKKRITTALTNVCFYLFQASPTEYSH